MKHLKNIFSLISISVISYVCGVGTISGRESIAPSVGSVGKRQDRGGRNPVRPSRKKSMIVPAAARRSPSGRISVRSTGFGAKGDGKTDDSSAFMKAITSTRPGETIVDVPPGHYRIGSDFTFSGSVNRILVFHPGSILEPDEGRTVTLASLTVHAPPLRIFGGKGKVTFAGKVMQAAYPQWWGAAGDDTADDRAALQEAVNAVNAGGGGTVRLVQGKYRTASAVTLKSNVTLEGIGPESILNSTSPNTVLGISAVKGVQVKSLRITGTYGIGIGVEGASSGINIQDNTLTGATRIYRPGGVNAQILTSGIYIDSSKDVRVQGNVVGGNGNAVSGGEDTGPHALGGHDIFVNSNSTCSRITIQNNRCYSTSVFFNICTFNLSYSTIEGNDVSGAVYSKNNRYGYGILIYKHGPFPNEHNTVVNNRVHHTDGNGIYLRQSPFSTVADNSIRNVCTRPAYVSIGVAALVIDNSNDTVIRNNTILWDSLPVNKPDGIWSISSTASAVGAMNNITIAHNTIQNCKGRSIVLTGGHRNCTVADNTIKGFIGGGIYALGGQEGHLYFNLDGISITDNTLSGGATGMGEGIFAQDLNDSTITGNNILKARRNGIFVYQSRHMGARSKNIAVSNNKVLDASQNDPGVYNGILTQSDDCRVVGNTARNQEGASQKYGIQMLPAAGATCEKCIARQNNVNGQKAHLSLSRGIINDHNEDQPSDDKTKG